MIALLFPILFIGLYGLTAGKQLFRYCIGCIPFSFHVSEHPITDRVDITSPGDPCTPSSTNFAAIHPCTEAYDNSDGSKYVNFDKVNTGLTITPSGNGSVTGLGLTSGGDATVYPGRNPKDYVVYGSNDGGVTRTQIGSGDCPIWTTNKERKEVSFSNTISYSTYTVIFPTIQDPSGAGSMQISEIELLAAFTSNPSWYTGSSSGTPWVNDGGVSYDPTKALDWNSPYFWNPQDATSNNWYFDLDFGETRTITDFQIKNYGDTTHDMTTMHLQWKASSAAYSTFVTESFSSGTSAEQTRDLVALGLTVSERTGSELRVLITATASGYQPWFNKIRFAFDSPQTAEPTTIPTVVPSVGPTPGK